MLQNLIENLLPDRKLPAPIRYLLRINPKRDQENQSDAGATAQNIL